MADFVTVYCNLPMGLRLRLHGLTTADEPVMGGGKREYQVFRPTGDEVVLNGTAAPFGQARKDRDGAFVLMVNGYGATPNVDKDFWDKWMEQNKGHPLLASVPPGLFARGKAIDALAQAKDMAGARSGLEPLTPTIQDAAGKVIETDLRAPRAIVRHEGARAT